MKTYLIPLLLLTCIFASCTGQQKVETYEGASLVYRTFTDTVARNIDEFSDEEVQSLVQIERAMYLSLRAWGTALIRNEDPAPAVAEFNKAWSAWIDLIGDE